MSPKVPFVVAVVVFNVNGGWDTWPRVIVLGALLTLCVMDMRYRQRIRQGRPA